MTDRTAVVVGGNRIPFARAHSAYRHASNIDMLTAALDGLAARFGLAGHRVGEVVGGAVLKHSRDFNLTHEAVLGSSLDPHSPACDLQQACATGLEATIYVSNKIRLGQIADGIAGGADSVSDAPMAVSDGLRRALLAANGGKMLAKDARKKMRLDEATFSRLLDAAEEHIEKRAYHLDKRQSILIIK